MYSAVKHQGIQLYKLAREGITIERKDRLVQVYSLELVDWQLPVATIKVVCGKGTYIRSIAHDLGQALGCGASLRSLARLRYGHFDIRDAISLSHLENAFRHGYWTDLLYPMDSVLGHWAAVVVGNDTGEDMKMGRSLMLVDVDAPVLERRCRAYTLDGRFIGVLRFNPVSGRWQPEKVLL